HFSGNRIGCLPNNICLASPDLLDSIFVGRLECIVKFFSCWSSPGNYQVDFLSASSICLYKETVTTIDKVVFSISGVAPISYPPLGALQLIFHRGLDVIQKCLCVRFRSWIFQSLTVHVPEYENLLVKGTHTYRNTTVVFCQAPFLSGVV